MYKHLIKLFLLLFVAMTACYCSSDDKQAEKDEQLILKYISDNHLTAQSTESGIYYVIIEPGTGARPLITSVVTVHYKGMLLNGNVFDSSYARGTPLQIALTDVIYGWQEGLRLFGRGGKGILIIPSRFGYGSQAVGSIPTNSVLVFEIHLIDFF